jgi:anaerobic magnesium-protoporphyrin IX monomethyl ester cyclase
MSVLLIRPSINRFRPSFLSSTSPLNLMYISAALKEAGVACRILDFESTVMTEETLFGWIQDFNPKIVGLTAFTPTVNNAGHIASLVKERYPDIVTVLGGVHVSALPHQSLMELPCFDYIFIGEGEIHFPEFCKALLAGRIDASTEIDIPGVCYRKPDGTSQINPPEMIFDLDSLPLPDRSVDFRKGAGIKSLPSRRSMRYAEILTSRGCPFDCTFCAVKIVHSGKEYSNRRVRQHSVEKVAEEIAILKNEHGVDHLNILDSTFTVNKKYVIPIVETIAGFGLTYNCNAIINTVDYEVLKTMAETGCQQISFGIETGSPEILKKVNKRIRIEEIVERVAIAREVGIPAIECSYIIGIHPDETEEDIRLTERLMHQVDADVSVLSIGIPLPGTEMFHQFSSEGMYSMGNDWDAFSFYGAKPNVRTRYVSRERLLHLQKEIMRNYYFSPRRISRRVRRLSSPMELVNSVKAAFSLLR